MLLLSSLYIFVSYAFVCFQAFNEELLERKQVQRPNPLLGCTYEQQ